MAAGVVEGDGSYPELVEGGGEFFQSSSLLSTWLMVEVGIVTAISFFSSLHLEQQEMKHAAFQSGSHHYCTFSPSQTQSPPPRNKSALKYDREHKVCIKVEGGLVSVVIIAK